MDNHELTLLGELEREIMEVLWQKSSSVEGREVFDKVKLKRKVAYTTVMTVMGRLVEKGLLKRLTYGKGYSYKAVYSKDRFLSRVSKQIISSLVANFGDIAVSHFAKELENIPPHRREKLVKLLKEAKNK
jgi:predicted transcriptional regulator